MNPIIVSTEIARDNFREDYLTSSKMLFICESAVKRSLGLKRNQDAPLKLILTFSNFGEALEGKFDILTSLPSGFISHNGKVKDVYWSFINFLITYFNGFTKPVYVSKDGPKEQFKQYLKKVTL